MMPADPSTFRALAARAEEFDPCDSLAVAVAERTGMTGAALHAVIERARRDFYALAAAAERGA